MMVHPVTIPAVAMAALATMEIPMVSGLERLGVAGASLSIMVWLLWREQSAHRATREAAAEVLRSEIERYRSLQERARESMEVALTNNAKALEHVADSVKELSLAAMKIRARSED